jgi:hypothetical protein
VTTKGTADGTLLTKQGEALLIDETAEKVKNELARESSAKLADTEAGHIEASPQPGSCSNCMPGNSSEKELTAGRSLQMQQLISGAVTRHVRLGYIVVIVGLLLNAAWMWYLPSVDTALAYNPHVQPVVY